MTDAVIDEIDGRMIRIGDAWLADFASCNYLGFDLDREIIAAIPEYIERWGTHPSWSRMLGSPVLYPQIEERLIELLGCEDALVIPTITLIHLSVIPVLAGDGTIFVDNRAHKTIYDGCQFASARGAKVKRFRFEDPDDLEQLLRRDRSSTRLICMDGVNSMTGNAPDLSEFARLARRYDAVLYVDDAHGFGVIGERSPDEPNPYGLRGNSVVRYCGDSYDSVVLVGGFSKSYSSLAAFVACPTDLKDLLKTAAPPYLYSGPSPIASLATVLAGFDVNDERGDAIRTDLWQKTDKVLTCLDRMGVHTPNRSGLPDRRGSAGTARRHRRRRPVPLRARHLRDARGLPARAQERGRVPDPGHRGELVGRDRPARRRARQARERVRPSPGRPPGVRGVNLLARVDWRGRLWTIYLGVGVLFTAAYLAVPPFKASGPLINLLGLSSSVAIAVGIYLHRPKARVAWLLFIVGNFLFFTGDLYTYSYPKLMGVEVEFPSIGDAVYLTVYPALVAGLLVLVRRRNPQGDRAGVIDSLIISVGIALLSWVFLVAPNIHLSGLTTFEKAVSAAYPLGDILLLAAAVRLAVDNGKRAPAFYLLIGSIVSLLAVDSAYTYALLTDAYNHQLSYDVGWIAYYLLWGAAALHPSMRTLEEPALETRTRLTPLRLGLLAAACLIAPGVRFYQAIDDPDVLVLIVASAAPLPPRRRAHGRSRPPGGASSVARAGAAPGGCRAGGGGRARAGQRGRDLGRPGVGRRARDGRPPRRC